MRLLIALLVQNPELSQLVPNLAPLRNLNEPGLDLLESLTELCQQRIGINTGQILEHWRDQPELHRPLEILASWNHLIEDEKIVDSFRETLKFLYLQLIDKNIERLIAKERTEGLNLLEKQELTQLLAKKQQK